MLRLLRGRSKSHIPRSGWIKREADYEEKKELLKSRKKEKDEKGKRDCLNSK